MRTSTKISISALLFALTCAAQRTPFFGQNVPNVPSGPPAYGNSYIENSNAAGATFTLTGRNIPAGSTIWLIVGARNSCGTLALSVTGTGSESFTQIGSNNTQTFVCSAAFRKIATAGSSSYVITATDTGGAGLGNAWFGTVVVTGVSTLNNGQTGFAGSGTSVSTSAAVTVSASAIIPFGMFDYYDADTTTAGSGATQTATNSGNGRMSIGYLLTSSSTTMTFNVSGTNYSTIHAASFQ